MGSWSFLSNHARVISCIAEERGVRLREIAASVEITERAAHRIVSELVADGYLTRHRVGARNFYEVHPEQPLRYSRRPDVSLGDLLRVLNAREPPAEPDR